MLSLVAVVVVVIGTVAQLNTILCEGTEPPPSPQIHPPSPQVSLNQRKFRAFILCLAWWWMVSGSAFSSLPARLGWMGLRKIRVHDEEGIQQISPLLRFSDFVQFESACVLRLLLLRVPISGDMDTNQCGLAIKDAGNSSGSLLCKSSPSALSFINLRLLIRTELPTVQTVSFSGHRI